MQVDICALHATHTKLLRTLCLSNTTPDPVTLNPSFVEEDILGGSWKPLDFADVVRLVAEMSRFKRIFYLFREAADGNVFQSLFTVESLSLFLSVARTVSDGAILTGGGKVHGGNMAGKRVLFFFF